MLINPVNSFTANKQNLNINSQPAFTGFRFNMSRLGDKNFRSHLSEIKKGIKAQLSDLVKENDVDITFVDIGQTSGNGLLNHTIKVITTPKNMANCLFTRLFYLSKSARGDSSFLVHYNSSNGDYDYPKTVIQNAVEAGINSINNYLAK